MNQLLYDQLLSGAVKWNQYRRDHPEVGMNPVKADEETEAEWRDRIKTIVEVDIRGGDLSDLVLSRYNFVRADFSGANCRNLYFEQCDLSSADFTEAQLENCRLQSCRLAFASVADCCLRGARFINCDGVLIVNRQTSFAGVEVLDSQLDYLCFEPFQIDTTHTEYSIMEMILKGAELIPAEAEVRIAEVQQID